MQYFAYVHCKPDGTPFYVGKGTRKRHLNFRDRNPYHKRIVNKYGAENILVGVLECSTNEISLELEKGIIKCLKRSGIELANLTDGGEGTLGRPCTELAKARVAEANRNRVWDETARVKMSKAMSGLPKPNQSKTMKAKGNWAKEANPFYGKGEQQAGAKNHMARAVTGVHPDKGALSWETLQAASEYIGVSLQAIAQAVKKGYRSKGWKLEYLK